jgi:serine/threonine protein kinase/Flp pilus assembly protein TadD
MDFISRDAFMEAMRAWLLDKSRPLGQILQDLGVLTAERRQLLETMAQEHVEAHQGDPRRSLAAVSVAPDVRRQLHRVPDDDVQASLDSLAPAGSTDPDATGPLAPGPEESNASDRDRSGSGALRYRILRAHARGGLGEVFVAEDQELHREVALKEIRQDCAHDLHSRGRFLREAELSGRLEHPGIVPVYGCGQHSDGRPFYAMRFIRGESLREAVGRFHDAAGPDQDSGARRLVLRGLLGRFVAACNAVAYAHSRGVLHRDLKPDNIMLGPFGETLVVDWGLAKVIAQTEAEAAAGDGPTLRPQAANVAATQAGSAVGTPPYMSPEAAAGRGDQVSVASDIYGLGATLYAILTGRPPVEGKDPAEVLHRVSRGEWSSPRQVRSGIPAALDAICRKAMALHSGDRYATALDLAADAEHWLADEPVSAYREPWWVRLGRWRRRHRTRVAVAAVLLLAGVSGGLWVAWQRAGRVRAVGEDLQQVAALLQQENWPEARIALERAEARLAGGGPEALRQRVAQAHTDLEMVARVEEIRLGEAERERAFPNLPETDAANRDQFAWYGLPVETLDPQEAADRIAASAIRVPLVAAVDHWARVKEGLATSDRDSPGVKRATKAEERQRLLAIARLADDDPWRQQVREAAARNDWAALERLARRPAVLLQSPTTVMFLSEQLSAKEAVALLRRAQRRHPGDFWINHQLSAYLPLMEPPRPAEAVAFSRAALASRPRSAEAHSALAHALQADGKRDEAQAEYREAIALRPDYYPAHFGLGNVLSARGELAEALAEFREAIRSLPRSGEAHLNLGNILDRQGKLAEAEAEWREAVQLMPRSPYPHTNLGISLAKRGKLTEAVAEYHTSLRLLPHHPNNAQAYSMLGAALEKQGKLAEALVESREAVRLRPEMGELHNNLGTLLLRQGKLAEAEAEFRTAVRLKADYADAQYNLGLALWQQGKLAETVAESRKALRLRPENALAYITLGLALGRQGKLADAEGEFRKAVRLNPDESSARINLGAVLAQQGQYQEAQVHLRKAHDLFAAGDPRRPGLLAQARRAGQLADLDRKVPDILRGKIQPANAAERVTVAVMCQEHKHFYAAAARFFADAFAAQPQLADDVGTGNRYNAACAAALAAAGKGNDAADLDRKERSRLRRQALAWLRADLTSWGNLAEHGPPQGRQAVEPMLRHWQTDSDLAGVRDAGALAKLPKDESQDWQKLWTDVALVLRKAAGQDKPRP